MTELRKCNRCKVDKPLSGYQEIGIKDYRRRVCRECRAVYHQALYYGDIKPLDRGASIRKCRRCMEDKPLSEFPKLVGKYSDKGWQKHTCKPCDSIDHAAREARRRKRLGEEYRVANRLRHKATYNTEAKRHKRLELKQMVMDIYGGAVCKCCGESCMSMLTIDHVNNDGAEHRRSLAARGSINMYFYLKQNEFPDGFQVLCYNCNMSKYRNKGTCEHLIEGSTTIPKGSRGKSLEARATQLKLVG